MEAAAWADAAQAASESDPEYIAWLEAQARETLTDEGANEL